MHIRFPRRAMRAFANAREGVAAVEFAMLLPVMAFVYLAAVELCELILVDRQVENIASSVADIVARDTYVSIEELKDLKVALPDLMKPKPVNGLEVRVSSIKINSATDARVEWSYGYYDLEPLQKGATVGDLPSQILNNSSIKSIVRAEARYTYTPVIGGFQMRKEGGLGHHNVTYTLKHSDYRRPRIVDPLPGEPR